MRAKPYYILQSQLLAFNLPVIFFPFFSSNSGNGPASFQGARLCLGVWLPSTSGEGFVKVLEPLVVTFEPLIPL
ncbi:hypothetical protein DPEC_G00093530 [Dallia pectoralis]|uniref:Uncharacterized protein n=1 Tax=Dallia pectoralis TaxID=75939 RepID=A0ACC2H125_DALPE|nr:hypothetical protein DPEC_G00093530 [Dallia pectoralis]